MKHNVLATTLALALAAAASAQTAKPPAKTFAAILPLEAAGADPVMAQNLSGRLRHELAQTGAFDMMEREKMQEILNEQGFQQSGACIVEVGQLIGVEKMVAGSIGLVGKTYTLNVRLIDVKTGRVDRSIVEDHTGTVDRLLTEVVRWVAAKLAFGAQAPGLRAPSGVDESKPLYKKWWFWTGLGAAAAGGTAAALLMGGGQGGGENPTDNTLPLPPNPPQAPVLPHP